MQNFSGDLHEKNVFPALTVCTLKIVRMCLWKSVSLNVSLYTTVPEHDRRQQQQKNLNDFFVLNVSHDCTSLVQNTLCTAVVLACV